MCAVSVLPSTWSGPGQLRLFIKPLVLYNFYFRDHEFRPDYGKLATLAAIVPSKSFQALTATARHMAQGAITEKFDLENSVHILENPDHPNTF